MLHIILMCITYYDFANDLWLAVYYIGILDWGNVVRQKTNSEIYLFKFKMGHKVAETTCSISKIFHPETANEYSAVVVEVLQRKGQPWKLWV